MRPTPRARALAYASVALAAILWGTWSLFLRPARVDPRWQAVLAFGTMTAFGTVLLVPAAARRAPDGIPRARRDVAWLVGLGIGDAGNTLLFFAALARTSVALATLAHYLAPPLVALLAPTLAGTPRRPGALARAAVGTAGLVLVLEPWRIAQGAGRPVLGALLGAGSAVFYAGNVCVAKRLAPRFSPAEQLVYHSAIAGSVALVVALVARSPTPSARGTALVAAGGLLVGTTTAVLFVRAIRRIPAEHASVLTLLEPLTAVVVGVLVFHEHVGFLALVGGGVVLGAGLAAARS